MMSNARHRYITAEGGEIEIELVDYDSDGSPLWEIQGLLNWQDVAALALLLQRLDCPDATASQAASAALGADDWREDL
jgi:hypothetical protein